MIRCSVCGTDNDDLAVLCSTCKSYLQTKVDTLDLFGTIWLLIEAPRRAMKRIVLARYKNYVYFLSALFGISLVYTAMWYRNLGKVFNDLFILLAGGFLAGPVIGILYLLLCSIVLVVFTRFLRGKATVRNTFAVVAYSTVPIAFSLVFILPVEIAIFGLSFFDNNPSPLVLKPVEYVVLIVLDVAAALWSWALLVEGVVVANGFTRLKSVLAGVLVLVLAGLSAAGLHFL
jgi:hypothetical protein